MIREYSEFDIDFLRENLINFEQNISFENIISNPFTKVYIYENNSRKMGFIVSSKYYERMEIDYIFVLEEYRNNGVASKLITYIIDNNPEIENITLEVNINNKPAINLYQKMGFSIVAVREKYYTDGTDAYLMERK